MGPAWGLCLRIWRRRRWLRRGGHIATGIQAVGFPLRFQGWKGSDGCFPGPAEPQNFDWEIDDGVATTSVLKITAHPPSVSQEILVLRCSCLGWLRGGQGWGFLSGASELI